MAWLVWSHPGSLSNHSPNTGLERRDLLAFAYEALGLKEFTLHRASLCEIEKQVRLRYDLGVGTGRPLVEQTERP